MNNITIKQELDSCYAELTHVKIIIDGLGLTSSIVPYLTKFAIIRACGSIELSFKNLIADFCSYRGKRQVKRFLARRIRNGPANPSYDNICRFLYDFDEDWKNQFKSKISSNPDKSILLTSLQSLVDARNDFAHGGSPTATIGDILKYFDHSRKIIEIMDAVVS